jgi:hypothetical protein
MIIYKISYRALLKHKEFETIKTRHENDLLGFHLEHAQLVHTYIHTYIPAQTFGFITHQIEIARIENPKPVENKILARFDLNTATEKLKASRHQKLGPNDYVVQTWKPTNPKP